MIPTTLFRTTLLALGLAFTTTTALPTTDLELSSLSPPPPPSTLTTTNNTTTDLNITESAHPILATRGEQWECKDYSETIVESSRGLGSPPVGRLPQNVQQRRL